MSNEDLSRRGALSGGAAAVLAGVGAALAVSAVGRDAEAQGMGDIAALNNLLRIEYETQQAYDLINGYLMAPAMDDPQRALAGGAVFLTRRFRAHHTDQAMRLTSLIRNFQGTPTSESGVVFMLPTAAQMFTRTVANFLRLACNREKAAAVASVEALKAITSPAAAELVAGLAGVQAQRFTVLYLLLKQAIVPGAMFSEATVDQLFSATVISADGVPDATTLRGIGAYEYTM